MTRLAECVRYLDEALETQSTPDYDQALNGLQLQNSGDVRRVGVAVDFSLRIVQQAIADEVNLLVVHHGMFWGEPRALVETRYERLRAAIQHDIAVYSSHLPLDRHSSFGNNVLLARTLGLEPSAPFGQFRSISIGVAGTCHVATDQLIARVRSFADPLGSSTRTTPVAAGRITSRWAIVTGAGASSDSLAEATAQGVDTLIVGEGPHHTAVDAAERGIVVIYAGHYATETLGVRALGRELEQRFGLPWSFLHDPTGL